MAKKTPEMKKGLNFMICILLTIAAEAQTEAPDLLRTQWDAQWISVPDQAPTGYQVCLFRKTLELAASPGVFFVHVSADNRYKLFINGELVSLGPARGDLQHWNYESLDIAAHLHAGKNTIAAQVWNEGDWRPEAQISLRTGFILQGATAAESAVNTNSSWKCIRDNSYSPIKVSMQTYYVTGPGELIQMELHPKNWQNTDFQDAAWKNAQTLFPGVPKTVKGPYGTVNGWMLTPSSIPQMEMKADAQSQAWARSAHTVLTLTCDGIADALILANENAKQQGRPLFCMADSAQLSPEMLDNLIQQTYRSLPNPQSEKDKMTVSQVALLGMQKQYPCAQGPGPAISTNTPAPLPLWGEK